MTTIGNFDYAGFMMIVNAIKSWKAINKLPQDTPLKKIWISGSTDALSDAIFASLLEFERMTHTKETYLNPPPANAEIVLEKEGVIVGVEK